uniref:hypothetical protein n=1 Tax=Sphingomonas bacterium TaxID=1895847 RepID=UPI0015751256
VMIAALVPMTAVFVTHADWFVHGPEREVAAQVEDQPGRTAIVYLDAGWAYAYYPLVYRYRGALAQYMLSADGVLHAIGAGGNPATPPISFAELRRRDRLLLVSIQPRTYQALRARAEGYLDPVDTQPPSGGSLGAAAGAWNVADAIVRPGIYWLRLTRLQRTDDR